MDVRCRQYLYRYHTGATLLSENKQLCNYDPQQQLLLLEPFLCRPLVNLRVEFRHKHIGLDSDSNVHLKREVKEKIY